MHPLGRKLTRAVNRETPGDELEVRQTGKLATDASEEREMSGRRNKLWVGAGLVAIAGAIALLIGGGLKESMVYFLTPSELQARGPAAYGSALRLGGLVEPGSVKWDASTRDLRFVIGDSAATIRVHSTGAPPAMFRDGIGVVVEGHYGSDGVFQSSNVMVKHSNEYKPPHGNEMPKEMYRSLLKDGS